MAIKLGKLPKGITIRKHKNTSSIQVAFTYKGTRCRETLNIPVTKQNIKYADNLLGEIKNEIERGTFKYFKHFPNSAKLKIFGHQVNRGKTVIEYLDEYQESAIKRGLSPSSIEGYRKLKLSVKELHKVPVIELTPSRLKSFILESKNAPKTLRNKFSYLRTAIAEAVTDGLVETNPIDSIKLSNYIQKDNKVDVDGEHNDVDPFTPKELIAISKACKPDELNLVQLIFSTGLRSSEWTALKWSDVDLARCELKVNRAIVHGQTKAPKTKAGKRIIPLNKEAVNALKCQLLVSSNIDGYVFTKTDYSDIKVYKNEGNRLNPDSFRKHRWKKILRRAKVRYRYPYQMRHSFATKHISQGINLWKIAKWMGHSSPQMLYHHYGSFIEEYEKEKLNDTPMTPKDLVV